VGGGQIAGLEDRPELLFQQVSAVQGPVGGLDGGQGAALVAGQRVGAFQQRSPGVGDAGGLLGAPVAAQPGGQPAADLINCLGHPRHDVERVIPTSG